MAVTPPVGRPSGGGGKPVNEAEAPRLWRKMQEDWIFNFSGMLAYNYLTATAPLALVGLAISGLLLSALAPNDLTAYIAALASQVPDGSQLVQKAMTSLSQSQNAGLLLMISIIVSVIAGSRLFIALENCFSVIYRLRERQLAPQNLVAIELTLLYAVLAPLAFIASGQLSGVFSTINVSGLSDLRDLTGATSHDIQTYLGRLAAGIFIAFIMFLAMYTFAPNRPVSWRRTWKVTWRGALVAAILLNLYEQLFPLYQLLFLHNASYSSVTGVAIVAVIFLYFIGFITLFGAEINAWYEGLRPLGVTLPDLFRKRDEARK